MFNDGDADGEVILVAATIDTSFGIFGTEVVFDIKAAGWQLTRREHLGIAECG